jgi:hypothetical protein
MSACSAWWVKCERSARKVVEFDNVFGERARVMFCDDHSWEFMEPAFRQKVLDQALDALAALQTTGLMKSSMRSLHNHPAQRALVEHQRSCDRCRRVRDWIALESVEGRLRSEADVDRVGRYVMAHCCSEGLELNHAVGMAMAGK